MFSCCRAIIASSQKPSWHLSMWPPSLEQVTASGWAVSIIKHWTGFGQLCVIIVGIFLPPLCVSYKVLTLWQLRKNIQERHRIKKLLFSRLLCNKCIWFTVTRYPVTLFKDDCTSSRDWDPDKKNNRARRDNNCYNGLLTQQLYNYETKIKCQWVRRIVLLLDHSYITILNYCRNFDKKETFFLEPSFGIPKCQVPKSVSVASLRGE